MTQENVQAAFDDAEKQPAGHPRGYICDGDGVRKISSDPAKPDIQLTLKPVWVEALSRDGARENWGRLCRLGRYHSVHRLTSPKHESAIRKVHSVAHTSAV